MIKIEGYDLDSHSQKDSVQRERIDQRLPTFSGVQLSGIEYVIDSIDLTQALAERADFPLPTRVYQVVRYDEESEVATAREITDRTVIHKVMKKYLSSGIDAINYLRDL